MVRAELDRYIALVKRIAYRVLRNAPSHVQVDDLISAGLLGLADALHKYAGAVPTETLDQLVYVRVRGTILDALRSIDPLSRDDRMNSRRCRDAVQTLTIELGRPPDDVDVASRLGIPESDLHDARARWEHRQVDRFETLDGEDTMLVDAAPRPDELVDAMLDRKALERAIAFLPPRLRELISLYYLDGRTFREIAETFGRTESRVCQLHAEAIGLLRCAMKDAA